MSRLLYRRQRALVHVLLWSTVDGLPAMFSGLLVATALDRGFLRHRTVVGLAWLAGLGVAALVRAAAVRRLFPWLAAVVEPLRDELVTSIVTTTLRKAVAGEPADLASVARLTGQVETVRDLVSATLRTVRQVAVTITAALIGLFVLAPAAALICLPPVLAALALYAALLPRLARREYAVLLAEERIAGDAGSALVALRDVVACGAEGRVAATIGSQVDAGAVAARSLARASGAQRMVVAVGGEVPLLMVLALSPWLMHRAGLTAGDAAGAATYLGANLLPAMRTLVETLGVWGLQLAIVGRRLAEAAVWPADPPRVPPALQRPTGYELRLEHASFAYGLRSDPIIHELDLLVPEDDHLAIVGPSGIGKSTLADIISGGIAPTTGDVLLGGTSLTRVDSSTIRHNLALLPQEAYVFAGSLRENLTYLCGVCSDRDLDAAVETLGLRQLVNRLGGYDAQIDSLSNGERQLIALARVWLSPARIVILDEATAHLDLATEAVVEEAFARRFGTLIVVAHRISSARRARRVLLMEDGRLSSGSVESHARSSRPYEQMVRQWQLGPAIGSA